MRCPQAERNWKLTFSKGAIGDQELGLQTLSMGASLGYWLRRIHQTLISGKGEEKNGGMDREKEVEAVILSKDKGEENTQTPRRFTSLPRSS